MTTTDLQPDAVWVANGHRPARRLRGLRMPVLPSGQWMAQMGGGIAALAGVWLQFGVPAALIVGGVASVVLGALREAGKV